MDGIKKIIYTCITIIAVCAVSFLCYKFMFADGNVSPSANNVLKEQQNDSNENVDEDGTSNNKETEDDEDKDVTNKGESSSKKENNSSNKNNNKNNNKNDKDKNKNETNSSSSSSKEDNSNSDNTSTDNNKPNTDNNSESNSNNNNDNNSNKDDEEGNNKEDEDTKKVYSKFESPSEDITVTMVNDTQIKVEGTVEEASDNNVYYNFIIKAPKSYTTEELKNAYIKIDGYKVNNLKIEIDSKGIPYCKINRNLRNIKGNVPVEVYWGAGDVITYTFNFSLEVSEN